MSENSMAFGPLGRTRPAAFDLHHRQTSALLEAAENLLTKCHDRLVTGQEGIARDLASRALALPRDEAEETAPALMWLALEFFSRLDRQVEAADENDQSWVDRAQVLLSETDGVSAQAVRGALAGILTEYELPHTTVRRVRRLIGDTPVVHSPLYDLDPHAERMVDVVLDLLRTLHRLDLLHIEQLTARVHELETESAALQARIQELEAREQISD